MSAIQLRTSPVHFIEVSVYFEPLRVGGQIGHFSGDRTHLPVGLCHQLGEEFSRSLPSAGLLGNFPRFSDNVSKTITSSYQRSFEPVSTDE